jgi:hypothetical protein
VVADLISQSYERNHRSVCDALKNAFAKISNEDMKTYPEDITEGAFSLALDCGLQRCRIQLFTPQEGDPVRRDERTYIQDRNEGFKSDSIEGKVEFVVSPGLLKVGDGHGRAFDTTPVHLRPAHVYCSVDGVMG